MFAILNSHKIVDILTSVSKSNIIIYVSKEFLMVDLRVKPFYLNNEQIEWVEQTIAHMTIEEKIGQLFVLLNVPPITEENRVKQSIADSNLGGVRWQAGKAEGVYIQNTTYQKQSEIPLLIAANSDDGGSSFLPEGTFVATAAQAAAGGTTETAYHMGLVAGREATSIGCNWTFNPVVDIYKNWRNTIVNTRCFGDNAEDVINNARAFIKGVHTANPNMACCCKHFPGDGVEELDQHLVMGVNSLDADEWEKSFGKVYRTMIEDGVETIMAGHIALPSVSRKLRPGIRDEEIMPATLSPELLTDLLRIDMGFNGLIITDATHMVGLSVVMKREHALPRAIASGCDMILFANDIKEDSEYIKEGLETGVISPQRLDDAMHRILGLKARLNLYNKDSLIPGDPSSKDRVVGCEQHKEYTKLAADRCVTLVKDTQQVIPIDPVKQKRAYLVYVQSTPTSRAYQGDPVKKVVVEELEKAGFAVDVAPNFHDLEVENGPSPMNFVRMSEHVKRKEFAKNHDVVFLVVNVKGYAQENNVRLRWSCNHSTELPWYIPEIPTIGISLNFTNHLIDVPQLRTLVNAYGSARENIRAAIEKICGKSLFLGKASETVFCGRWETRL